MSTMPNLLLIGPPKCATSSLHGWLCAHPGIAPGVRKELFFLMDRDHPLKGSPNFHDDGIDAYRQLYSKEAANAPVRIDSTTHYFYQRTALDYARSNPAVRVCVVLRDPAERVFSSFSYTRNNLANLSSDLSFARYLEVVDRNEPLWPKFSRSRTSAWVLERDIAFSHYSRYLAPWIETLGAERVEIVLFEDLRERPLEVISRVLASVGLPDEPLAGAPEARNVTRPVRFAALHRTAQRLNAALPIPRGIKSTALRAYHRLQASASQPARETAAVDALRHRFLAEVDWVEALTGRDLSHWRPGPRSERPE